MSYPPELFKGCTDDDGTERAARMGRLDTLEELGFFGLETNLSLARKERAGSFIAQIRRKFSNTYGDTGGCDTADIEMAAEMKGVFNDIFDTSVETGKYLTDK